MRCMDGDPKLRADLVHSHQESGGQTYIIIKDPRTGRYFRVREPEFWLISQFDGQTDFETVAERFAEKYQMRLPEGAVKSFAAKLDSLFFLETDRAEYESSRSLHWTTAGSGKSLLSRLMFVRLSVFNPEKYLDHFLTFYRPLHGRALFLVSLAFLALGVVTLAANLGALRFSYEDIFTFGSISTIVISTSIVIFFHELAHMVTCRLHGGDVRQAGLLILYLQPCFFADLSDAWMFENKSHRLATLWAGPYVQLLTLAAAALVWRVTVVDSTVNEIALIVTVVNLVTVLFNFNPLIKLDGYYLLSDWLEIPNLRAKAFGYYRALVKNMLFGIPYDTSFVRPESKRERRIFFWYAALSSVYTLIILGYIYILLWGWLVPDLGLWAITPLVAAPLIIVRSEIYSAIEYFFRPLTVMKNLLASPLRAIVYSLLLAASAIALFAVPFTERVSGAVEIRSLQRFAISGGAGGQIKTEQRTGGPRPDIATGYLSMSSLQLSALTIHRMVSLGDLVRKGDTLLALSSNQVVAELQAAGSALATLEARLALLKSPPKAESLLVLQADARALESEFLRAESESARKRELYGKNLIAKNEMEDAQALMEVSSSRWESARAQMALFNAPPKPEQEAVILNDIKQQQAAISFLESQAAAQVIVSPFNGRVAPGNGDQELVVVIDDTQVEAIIIVSDYDIEKVSTGQRSNLKVRSFPGAVFNGAVSRISQTGIIENEAGRFEVALLYDNSDGRLKEGMSGYARIEIGRRSLFGLIAERLGSLIRVEFWSLW
ncbi:MAG: efflux RND transporter periplasmic adaptor subunit [candidate division Zixibacteria bacterium]|nr:efflux RND transporter periplasmic adaptor subunit [candidate division Zixibacteria bacterium]